MVLFEKKRLEEILGNIRGKKILVIGDLMIDRYLWGNVSRISPEAPVPIINIEDEEIRFGGAANVANNIIGLGGIPILAGVVGKDRWGEIFRGILRERHLVSDGIIEDPDRPTTLKTRIIGNNQHIARVDREKTFPISQSVSNRLLQFIQDCIADCDAIILEDYNKGVLIPELVHAVTELATASEKIITVDPKFDNFLEYKNVTVFKPNKKETEEALAIRIKTDEEVEKAGRTLLDLLKAQAVLITLGERGMALFDRNGTSEFISARARQVADVSGAGDTVIATLTCSLAAGAELKEAVTLANFAAGVVCEQVGVVPITTEQLKSAVLDGQDDMPDA